MKIAACFSSRADYAPLYPVISELEKRGAEVIQLNLEVGLMKDDTPLSCSLSLIKGMRYLAAALSYENPDVVLLLGDRYETLGAAQIATLFQIPIAHIHGGETTEGSFDNDFRHAITQLATHHFVSTEEYAAAVARMRGSFDNVHVVGAPGLDNINDLPPREFPGDYFLVTYHPTTKQTGSVAIFEALRSFPEYRVLWTGVNRDPGHKAIREAAFRTADDIRCNYIGDMDSKRYLSAMKYAACCVGNSSSFLIEAPALGVPSVNIGDRQKGRLHGPSVLDIDEDADSIVVAIKAALTMYNISVILSCRKPFESPYGGPGASKMIADILTPDPTSQSVAA